MAVGRSSLLFATLVCFLTGCSAGIKQRNNLADKIAFETKMVRQVFESKPFLVTGFVTNNPRYSSIGRVYIEGDGLAWVSKTRPSLDPTPIDPYMLRIAQADKWTDKVYLSRPCHYTALLNGSSCPTKYWTTHRYAPEVVDSYAELLNRFKKDRGWEEIELIGYSGGGALALLIAKGRSDIRSVRTIAGNVDIDAHSNIHEVDLMPYSLNPAKFSESLSMIPQLHFVGAKDWVVPPAVAESYRRHFKNKGCVGISIQKDLEHGKGWTEVWPRLLSVPVSC